MLLAFLPCLRMRMGLYFSLTSSPGSVSSSVSGLGRVHLPRQEDKGTEAVPQGTRAEHRLRRLRVV